MTENESKTVAIITIGNELLVGDTVNTNAAWLGRELTELGAIVDRITVVPDRIEAIAETIRFDRFRYDKIVVTGGLGPTHDDVTMEAVARAFDTQLRENRDVRQWLIEEGGYSRDDLVEGTADLPVGAKPLHNVVGVAPGAVIDDVYVLPGVPKEMKAMFESIAVDFVGIERVVETIRTPLPESALVGYLVEARDRFEVSVGSYPGETVRVKVSGRDAEAVAAAARWLRKRILP